MKIKFITAKVHAHKNSRGTSSFQYVIQNKELKPFANKWVVIKVMEVDFEFMDKATADNIR